MSGSCRSSRALARRDRAPAGGGQSFSGDFVVATRSPDGRRLEVVLRRVGQGRGRGHPVAAPVGGARRPARRMPPAPSCPPPTPICSARTGTRASPPRSISRSTSPPATTPLPRRTPAGGPSSTTAPGVGRCSAEAAGPLLGVTAGRRVPAPAWAGSTAATPCCSTPTASSRSRTRDLHVGIDRMLGAAERLVSPRFRRGRGPHRAPRPLRRRDRRPRSRPHLAQPDRTVAPSRPRTRPRATARRGCGPRCLVRRSGGQSGLRGAVGSIGSAGGIGVAGSIGAGCSSTASSRPGKSSLRPSRLSS